MTTPTNIPHHIQEQFQANVRELEAFGHRGSATKQEAQAAKHLLQKLQQSGLTASLEPFLGSHTNGGRLVVHVLLAWLGLWLAWISPWLTLFCGVIAITSLILEAAGTLTLLSTPLVRAPSQNVVAQFPAPSGSPTLRLILMAHYDTQRTGWLWNIAESGGANRLNRAPGVVKSPIFPIMVALVLQCLTSLLLLGGLTTSLTPYLFSLTLLLETIALLILGNWAMGAFVPGANDNATGVAACFALLELWKQNPPPHVQLDIVFTGCEESGLLGAHAWAKAHTHEQEQLTTRFLNIDSIGYGNPRYLGTEYTLAGVPVHFPPSILTLCEEIACSLELPHTQPHTIPVQTDGAPLIHKGFSGTSLISCMDDGTMPNYHLPTDVSEHIDWDAAWKNLQFAWAFLKQIANDPDHQNSSPNS